MEINTNSQNVVPPYNVIVLSLNLRRKKVLTQATNVMKLEVVCVCVCVCQSLSRVRLFGIQQTVACQASLSVDFSRQEHCSGLPFPSPEELPNSGIEPWSPVLQADSLPFELQEAKDTTLSEISQTQKDERCLTPLTGDPWRGQVHRHRK